MARRRKTPTSFIRRDSGGYRALKRRRKRSVSVRATVLATLVVVLALVIVFAL